MAVAKAAAQWLGIPLYGYLGTPFNNELSYPIGNIMGGSPYGRVGIVPDLQEHQIIPVNAEIMSEAAIGAILQHRVHWLTTQYMSVCDRGNARSGGWLSTCPSERVPRFSR